MCLQWCVSIALFFILFYFFTKKKNCVPKLKLILKLTIIIGGNSQVDQIYSRHFQLLAVLPPADN